MIRLETDRLCLRELRSGDIPALIDLWTDPEVTRFAGGPREVNALRGALEEDLADPTAEAFNLWPVEERATGQVIGHCGLLDKELDGETEIELVYFLATSSWGRGYATEIGRALRDHAFKEMNLPRLVSLVAPDNTASERVAAKVGMSPDREITRAGGEVRRVYAIERSAQTP